MAEVIPDEEVPMEEEEVKSSGEPLWTTAGMTAAVAALIALLVAFGVELTPEQQLAITGAVAVIAPTIVALVARPHVSPYDNVVAIIDKNGEVVAGPASESANGTPVAVLDAA